MVLPESYAFFFRKVKLFLQSVAGSFFPELLKYPKVKPLYKRDKKSCISNYRLISLPTAFSKIFEKVMNRRVIS
jgi:hypothetical protein